jgi:hypothetical protein
LGADCGAGFCRSSAGSPAKLNAVAEIKEMIRFLTILTGRNLPKIQQPREPEPSIINEKTVADFSRVVEQTRILARNTEGQNDGKA